MVKLLCIWTVIPCGSDTKYPPCCFDSKSQISQKTIQLKIEAIQLKIKSNFRKKFEYGQAVTYVLGYRTIECAKTVW